ncbi:related to mitochondrial seryl-tRNA synthetases [Melanopsichium pennsylvanicum]|uniref:serine--tRNA ligase n=2 Tax=Melanopsichium pennsylvanicum TaxID=63383 RepID=A0AAJ4XQE5_9BASI|nr:related to mitochondrial seryl-tRNA synthetases [Melanopsichium pennsylvanicum 4]SNX85992.1 related to mitochondrial seryl-tRNA synthetases [Melanopsichium pennsylvanicum]
MFFQGPSSAVLRAIAHSSSYPRRYRYAVERLHSSSRHASTSRFTLSMNKSAPRSNSASSSQAKQQSNNEDTSSSLPAPKLRRALGKPSPGRGVTNRFIDEAKRDMQLRKMPYDLADLNWLREARSTIYTLNEKERNLQAEQKKLTFEFAKFFSAKSKARKAKEKEKEKVDATKSKSKSDDATAESSVDTGQDVKVDEDEEHVNGLRQRARKIKGELDTVQRQLEDIRDRSAKIRLLWPNHCHPDVPVGPEENAVLVSVKDPLNMLPSEFDVMKESWNESVMQVKHFPDGPQADPKRQHLSLAASAMNSEVDMASGLLATGSSWPYLLGSISLLEHALSQYAMSIAVRRGFLPVSPPDVIRADLADRCGFRPRNERAKQTYFLENTKTKDNATTEEQNANYLCLAATAEIPLAGLLAARILNNPKLKGSSAASANEDSLIQGSELPIRLVALGHAFRAEAGARGADTRGLYRVHQFSKIEMYVATDGDVKSSNAMLEELRSIQEEVIGGLGLPYRVLDMPTEELGASAYRKYDIEVWMPGRGSWGEVSSASNCTDFQAQRLAIKMTRVRSLPNPTKDSEHWPMAHTLNATAAAIPRLIVAILENHGVEKGKLVLPDTLKPFWLAGDKDDNVTWLHTGFGSDSPSRLQRAMAQVRSIAKKNGTDATTMVASFFILHELTAIVPLVIMFYVFGALGVGTAVLEWLLGNAEEQAKDSESLMARFRGWARLKEERFERYCRRKGFLGFEKQDAESIDAAGDLGKQSHLAGSFANMVAAYILVKALIPVRIGASVALAGPFSRTVLEPLKNLIRPGVLRRSPDKRRPATSS